MQIKLSRVSEPELIEVIESEFGEEISSLLQRLYVIEEYSIRGLAEILGISRNRMKKLLERCGIEIRSRKEQCNTECHRSRQREITQKLGSRPAERKRRSLLMKSIWNDEEKREQILIAQKQYWQNDVERRETARQRVKEYWQNSEYRQNMSRMSKDTWQNPQIRKRRIETITRAQRRPMVIAKKREAALRLWQNPFYKRRVIVGVELYWSQPGVREEHAKRTYAFWQDPEYRERVLYGVRRYWGLYYAKKSVEWGFVKEFPCLSFEEEKELLNLVQSGDMKARFRFICSNLRLVGYVAWNIWKNLHSISGNEEFDLTLEDLKQEGCIGLIKAVDGFSSSFGSKFSTYAVPSIRNAIIRGIHDKSRTVRWPDYYWVKDRNDDVRKELILIESISLERGPSSKKEEDLSFIETLDVEYGYQLPDKEASLALLRKALHTTIKNAGLSKREKEVVILYSKRYTFEEIGEHFRVSRQRIHQLYQGAMGKIRNVINPGLRREIS